MAIFDLKANIDLKQNLNLYTTCKQLDSLNLILSVFDNSVQTNLTNYNVRLKAMKADKVPLVQEHTGISISSNVITIETDEQLTTTSGKTLIELQFIDEVTGKKKATFNLVLIVVSTTLEVDRGISKATYTLLEELENKLDQASDFFENIEDAIVANNNLKKTISNSETAESNLETAITNANNKKNEVYEAITNATNKIEEVEQSIINANNSKTELDASKTIADTTKIDLDNANVQAEKNIEELNKLGDATDLAAKVQTNTENISKNTKSIESLDAQMSDMAIDVKNFGAKGDGLTDDTVAFQNALIALTNGGTLIIPTGTYLIQDILYIPSNTKILGNGKAILKRNSDTNALMVTKSDGTTGGYDACKNITIENIIFDGSQSNFLVTCTLFSSGHATNITVRKCTFKNLDAWHMVEFNSTKDSLITECTFDNYGYGNDGSTATEMLQLDAMTSSDAFPWYGPYDNTSCTNIIIEKNVFKNSFYKAIGNHTFTAGVMLSDIYIKNNLFTAIGYCAIELDDIAGLNIINNRFINTKWGILSINQQNANKNILIEGNNYDGTRTTPYVADGTRFVGINPSGRNGFTTFKVKILNNIITNANGHAIGTTASDVEIQGNNIKESYGNGIYFYGGDIATISNNIIYGNNIEANVAKADIVVGNSAADVSSLVVVTGNMCGKIIAGSNILNVFIHGNIANLGITSGTAVVKNNVISNVWTA